MMEKHEVLAAVRELIDSGELTSEEIIDVIPADGKRSVSAARVEERGVEKQTSISDILYYIGGGIIFAGIATLFYGSWEELGNTGRLLVSLGSAVVFYAIGALANNKKKLGGMSSAFFLISALVFPIGFFVLFNNAGMQTETSLTNTVVSAVVCAIFAISYFCFKRNVLMIFSIIFGTWLFFALTNLLLGSSDLSYEYYVYRTMIVGISYMLFGYAFSAKEHLAELRGWLYGFGSLSFLGAAIALSNTFWEVIYPGLVFGIIFLSIKTKSRAFLVWGSLFLMGYIIKITAKYFSSGLSWPIALAVAGLSLIVIGYYSFYISNKYLSQNSSAEDK